MRAADYMRFASKDLRRQPLRSLLTIVAIMISTLILITMAALTLGGRQAITEQFGDSSALKTITVTKAESSGALSLFGGVQQVSDDAKNLNNETVKELADIQHVQDALPRAHIWEFNAFTIEGSEKQFVAQTEGVPFDSVALSAGALFTSNDDKNVVIIGKNYAKELGRGDQPESVLGKTITITTQKGYRGAGANIPPSYASAQENEAFNQQATSITARIVGITDSGSDQNSLLIPLGWAHDIRTARYNEANEQKSINQLEKDGYTSIQVRVNDIANIDAVSQAIAARGYGQFSALEQSKRIQELTTIMWVILGSVALIAIIAAALGVMNTMLMTVSEQRYTIGVWRAIGARRHEMKRLFLLQAGLLGLVGGLLGAGLGIAASSAINAYVASLFIEQGLRVTTIAETPVWLIATTLVATTIFGILAGLYPATRAARQDPSEALRAQ